VAKPARPDVSDPALKQALDAAGPAIEEYHANLDLISRDIKAVEQYLISSGIRIPTKVRVTGTGFQISPEEPFDSEFFSGEIFEDDDYLEWCPITDDSDRWRLMYRQVRHYGHLELCDGIAVQGPSLDGRSEEIAFSPFIETPVAVRLRVHRGLPELVAQVGKQVSVRPLDTKPLSDEDIPF
jgi:hypothetical protein